MTGDELRKARVKLGQLWGLPRPIHASELGRALQLSPSDPGESIRHYEKHRTGGVPGPIAVAVTMMLAGALPPGGVPATKA
jgi:hypothetical protein